MRQSFSSLVENASVAPAFLSSFFYAAFTSFHPELIPMWSVLLLAFPAALTMKYFSSDAYEFEPGVNFQSPASEWIAPVMVFLFVIMVYAIIAALISWPLLYLVDEAVRLSDSEYFHTAQFVVGTVGYLPVIYYWVKLEK